jgi:hypothetical protein
MAREAQPRGGAVSTYRPAEGTYPGMPPCEACGANFHLHRLTTGLTRHASGLEMRRAYDNGEALHCPRREPERTDNLDEARAALERATAGGDEAAVFVARGNLQRLEREAQRAQAPDPRRHWPVDFEEGEA